MGRPVPLPVPPIPSHLHARPLPSEADRWHLPKLAGRLVEISGIGDTAGLTVACGLVREAQQRGEPAAWVTLARSTFFPPDAAEGGVDLEALIVIRVPTAQAAARAADRLLRSNAFGLLILDLGTDAGIPTPLLSRVSGLAMRHRSAVVLLTEKDETVPSLGSLVSVRVEARRQRIAPDRFRCRLVVHKDKQGGPAWTHAEECRGPAGLR